MKKKAPFPFFGQGEAGYYEWFEMWIWFERPVAIKERKAALRGAPALCKLDAQWPQGTLLWASTGDQWIQRHLEEYGTKKAKAIMRGVSRKQNAGEDLDDDELDDTIAMGHEQEDFNADIDWLLALHEKRSILFAARREDGEAGGTKLGAWHRQSVAMFRERVLPTFEKLAAGKPLKPDDLRRSVVSIVLGYLGEPISPAVRALGKDDSD